MSTLENDDPAYRLSAKGFLLMEIQKGHGIETIWDNLTEFVRKQALENGMKPDGIPCLVLVDGGHCITAEKSKP